MCNVHTTDLRSYFALIYGSKESDERTKWSISVIRNSTTYTVSPGRPNYKRDDTETGDYLPLRGS